MAASGHLKSLKTLWGDSCHGMWVELLCVTMAESHVISNYASIHPKISINEMFYTPGLAERINGLTRDIFLERSPRYRHSIVTNRIVILSASFEAYFSCFVDAYIANRSKFFDSATNRRTTDGNKLFGEIRKIRGLAERIRAFADLTGSGIKTIEPLLSYLNDVYTLRNVLAHQAGIVDQLASQSLTNIKFAPGDTLIISPAALVELAAPVIKIAELLDRKMVSEYDSSIGAHRPDFVAETLKRNPPKIRSSHQQAAHQGRPAGNRKKK